MYHIFRKENGQTAEFICKADDKAEAIELLSFDFTEGLLSDNIVHETAESVEEREDKGAGWYSHSTNPPELIWNGESYSYTYDNFTIWFEEAEEEETYF